jgi:hypothetical protein
MDYFDWGISERSWRTARHARETFDKLKSEAQRLKMVKEQILIRKLGFGWSQSGYHYSSEELLEHLINVVIPLEIERGISKEAPMKFSTVLSEKYTLGTLSALDSKMID